MLKEYTGLGLWQRWLPLASADPVSDEEPGKAVLPLAEGGFCRLRRSIRFSFHFDLHNVDAG